MVLFAITKENFYYNDISTNIHNMKARQLLRITGMNVVYGIPAEIQTVKKVASVSLMECSIDV